MKIQNKTQNNTHKVAISNGSLHTDRLPGYTEPVLETIKANNSDLITILIKLYEANFILGYLMFMIVESSRLHNLHINPSGSRESANELVLFMHKESPIIARFCWLS